VGSQPFASIFGAGDATAQVVFPAATQLSGSVSGRSTLFAPRTSRYDSTSTLSGAAFDTTTHLPPEQTAVDPPVDGASQVGAQER